MTLEINDQKETPEYRKIKNELKDSEEDNKMIENIINRAVNSVEIDKGLPRIVSFRL